LAGDAVLLATAWALGHHSAHPDAGATLWAIVILVGLAVAVGAYPFIAEDARKYDQALDDRQKALQVLAGTVATAAEQVSVAAAGLQAIADAARENFRKSEALTGQLAGHIAAFDRRLGAEGAPQADTGGEGDARIDAAVKKITRAASALEVTLTKTVEVVRTLPPFMMPPPAGAPVAPPPVPSEPAPAEVPPVFAEQIAEIKPVLPATDASAAPIPMPAPPAEGATAAEAAPPEPLSDPRPVRKRAPRRPKVEAAPPASATPPEAPAPIAAAGPETAAEPGPAPVPAEPAAAPLPTPEAVADAAVDTIPPLSFGDEDQAMDEDFNPPPPEPELAAAPAAAPSAETSPAPAAAAGSADRVTRLVVTAYIGIGNRLFIRGDGPGLAWDRGVPLTFVSIGKWRWETSDASRTIHFRLFKNDTVECTALGEQTVEPGAQQELSAAF
jgi:hypothetical protein